MSPQESLPHGVVVDPHTAHVMASYLVCAAGLGALTLWAWLTSRSWAKRQRAAAAQEQADRETQRD